MFLKLLEQFRYIINSIRHRRVIITWCCSIVGFCIFFVCCKQTPTATTTSKASPIVNYQQLAKEKLGGKFTCSANESNTFMLCSARHSKDLVTYTSFFVMDLLNGDIVHEQSRAKKTAWQSDNVLTVSLPTGMPTGTKDENTYLFNVKEKKTYRANP